MTSGPEQAANAARAAQKNRPHRNPSIIGGVLSAIFSKETGMDRYSKLFGTIIGSGVGWAASWLALHTPIATCVSDACSVLGFSSTEITASITILMASIFTHAFPKNA